jgi:superfamily II DNA or RNA helicase
VLKDIESIRHRLYRLPRDPLVDDVLNPAFSASVNVSGAFGWFSSAWLATLAHGLARYLSSPQRGILRFVIAPALFETDHKFLDGLASGQRWALDQIVRVIGDASSPTADVLERHAVECLGWMMQNQVLDLRVAIPKSGSNYHPKMWLFDDGRDQVLVRGSANATARALGTALEHMDVDCSWIDSERTRQSMEILDDWMQARDENLQAVIPLPQALRDRLTSLAPPHPPSVEQYTEACTQSLHSKTRVSAGHSFAIPRDVMWETGKYSHQGEAVRAWEQAKGIGLIEMATGAGKTMTALICACRLHLRVMKPLLVVVSAPTRPLVSQWKRECERFGLHVVATDATDSQTQRMLFANALTRLSGATPPMAVALVVTNNRVADPAFQRLVSQYAETGGIAVLHVGDEAHSLGSEGFRKSPGNFADYRLGISATPMRQYDEEGTEHLLKYFGKVVFSFGLDRAIGVCLVPYEYHVSIAEIGGDELQEFLALSAQISRKLALLGRDLDDVDDESLTALLVRRRAVVENACDKIRVLRTVVQQLRDRSLTLVYTSSKNPAQLEQALKTLSDLGVSATKVTEVESSQPEQFDAIIQAFQDEAIDMLVAKRVLDEGVDIPPVRRAIMLASSSVEREWIQRRGRILRLSPGKTHASIHDVIALPPPMAIQYDRAVLQFISSELDRVRAFSRHATDPGIAATIVERIHQSFFVR